MSGMPVFTGISFGSLAGEFEALQLLDLEKAGIFIVFEKDFFHLPLPKGLEFFHFFFCGNALYRLLRKFVEGLGMREHARVIDDLHGLFRVVPLEYEGGELEIFGIEKEFIEP